MHMYGVLLLILLHDYRTSSALIAGRAFSRRGRVLHMRLDIDIRKLTVVYLHLSSTTLRL